MSPESSPALTICLIFPPPDFGYELTGNYQPLLFINDFSENKSPGAKVNFLNEKSNQKVLASVHPETPDKTLPVSDSERRHFTSRLGNQGFARRRT
jgi:hypothetical protein